VELVNQGNYLEDRSSIAQRAENVKGFSKKIRGGGSGNARLRENMEKNVLPRGNGAKKEGKA
jgi:hypothetical protein